MLEAENPFVNIKNHDLFNNLFSFQLFQLKKTYSYKNLGKYQSNMDIFLNRIPSIFFLI